MAITGLQAVTDAMLMAGISGQGDPISAGDSSLALRILNRMMDTWNNDIGMIYTVQSDTFTMVTGQQTYLSTALASGLRPIKVDSLIVSLSGIDYEVDIIDTDTFQSISYKPINAIPMVMSPTMSYPIASFDFYPRPYAPFVCTMQVFTPLPDTIAAATSIALPPGYEGAIVNNLAVQLCPAWGRSVPPDLRMQASNSRKALKRLNYEPAMMETGLGGSVGQVTNGFIYQGWR